MIKQTATNNFVDGPHKLRPSILREYDIRGIVGQTLSQQDAYYIGKAFGSYVLENSNGKVISVARDGRLSSPELCQSLIDGLLASGADVINIGVGPTPMLYFSSHLLKCQAGIMVTGSHNPPSHNGFKFTFMNKPFFGADITRLGQAIAQGDYHSGAGRLLQDAHTEVFETYLAELLDAYSGDARELKVAWDPGNGAAGMVVEALCKLLPGEHVLINTKVDGNFPAHHPDPTTKENLAQLIEVVCEQKCDFGVAFDGDADRIGVVDHQGQMISGDQLLTIFALHLLKHKESATVITDVKSSQYLFDMLADKGANMVMWKTGHSLIKDKMAETHADLAGEMSGHIFFADKYYGFDDGIYAAVRLLALLADSQATLSELVVALPKAKDTGEIRIDCPDERKFTVIDEIKLRLQQAKVTFLDIDGIRCHTSNGWWLVRASNTQAALSLRCESENSNGLAILQQELANQLAQSGVEVVW